MSDQFWMREALRLAYEAKRQDEVPVGAVIVQDNICLGRGWNQVRALHDPTAHAEILAIRAACHEIQYERLTDAILYVTLEPCAMCMGAILQSRMKRIVFSTRDWRAGTAGSCLNLCSGWGSYPALTFDEGLFQQESETLLQQFFQANRAIKSAQVDQKRS